MAEQLASLRQNGNKAFTVSVKTLGNNTASHYGFFVSDNSHPYNKMKVVSYENLSLALANYPAIEINGTTNYRPAIGTVFDITKKDFQVTSITTQGNYTQIGITVELS